MSDEGRRKWSEEEVEHAMSVADAANALAGYEASEAARELIRRHLRGETTDTETIELVADLARAEVRKREDPVVVYDTMREAATRLMAEYRRRLTAGGPEDPAMQEMRSILAQVEAVDPHDIQAQKTATAEFTARRSQLESPASKPTTSAGGETPSLGEATDG
jgi:hypothetical protein